MKVSWICMLLLGSLGSKASQKEIKTDNSWKNLNINRKIDLSRSYIQETSTIVIQNIGNTPLDEYFWIIDNDITDKISYIKAKEKDEKNLFIEVAPSKENPFNDVKLYIIKLSKPVLPQRSITIEIDIAVIDTLKPFPDVLSQDEIQHLKWEGLKYSLSIYSTEKQKTIFKISANNILSYSQFHKGSSANPVLLKSHLIYNFPDIVKPFNKEFIYIHYTYERPITVIKHLKREAEISHWGNNIAVRNTYSIINAGARLKENFSRLKWVHQLYYGTFHAAILSLQINLKTETRDTYHIDKVGVVYTGEFISNSGNTTIKIKPRYPIFGGWNYSCTIGWNMNLNNFLRKKNNNVYILKIPFVDGPINVYYKNISVNIILPEGSRVLDVVSRIPISKSEISTYKTYMDVIGRTSIKLFATNLVDTISSEEIFILYDYSLWNNFRKPLTISIAFGVLFLSSSLLKKLKIKIGE
ncbi:hypothetical protein PNEG_02372 [Pneumocystis murina B123]|uniref:Dolichyl-diphosphooligosaccharide--protein glycosyltransferase subunit 1 n=1 Tax=Pneumocystis murina (strain B123) TaxID=1069680 RepID=M7PG39_PNEMU|nr:hypothetical protein PNEG_02372 [Pneumocystis murina B123]EMR09429.1 hypothetical protein PNEG_02372 [Pneumocystis murina B123]